MSNELLAKVALNAMRGDAEEAQLLFEEYCEKSDTGLTPKELNLAKVATSCMEALSGDDYRDGVCDIAKEFGFSHVAFSEAPNERDQVTDNLEISQESSTN